MSGNTAYNAAQGINNSGVLTLGNDTITNNLLYEGFSGPAGQGGGIYNSGTLTIYDSTLFAVNTSGFNRNPSFNQIHTGYGGAIYNTGTLTLSDDTLSGNTPAQNGNLGQGLRRGRRHLHRRRLGDDAEYHRRRQQQRTMDQTSLVRWQQRATT